MNYLNTLGKWKITKGKSASSFLSFFWRFLEYCAIDPSGRFLFEATMDRISSGKRNFNNSIWIPQLSKQLHPLSNNPQWSNLTCHAHAFHEDFYQQLSVAIMKFPEEVNWIVTVPLGFGAGAQAQLAGPSNVRIVEVQNRGRNFGALCSILSLVPESNFLLHVHSKKSKQLSIFYAEHWARTLLGGLLDAPMVSAALSIMQTNPEYVVYYPVSEQVTSKFEFNWGANFPFAKKLLKKLNVPSKHITFPFPAGGMFIANPWLVEKLRELDLRDEDFPDEPTPLDGSPAHAVERLVGYVPFLEGKRHLTLSRQGILSFDTSFIDFIRN